MSEEKLTGTIGWTDLTAPNADEVRDFYQSVVGWSASEVSMGDYSDYSMIPAGETEPVAGVCHAKGVNADLPAQWLIYIYVDNLERSMADCDENGGKVIFGPKGLAGGRYCVIQDPAGAVCGLYEPGKKSEDS